MKKIILFIISVIFLINNFVQAQNNESLTYWYYRDRLKYFVVPGSGQGESEVMDIRNRLNNLNDLNNCPYWMSTGDNCTWGQQLLFMGYYLGTLATEYALLSKINNPSSSVTAQINEDLQEICWVLSQFDYELDKPDVSYWGDDINHFNGFFVRENVPCDFLSEINYQTNMTHSTLLNQNLTSKDVWNQNPLYPNTFNGLKPGQPGYVDNIFVDHCNTGSPDICNSGDDQKSAESQDEVIHMLVGLALAYKLVPDIQCSPNLLPNNNGIKTECSEIACRIVEWLQNESLYYCDVSKNHKSKGDLGNSWELYAPDGTDIMSASNLSYGFSKALAFFNANNAPAGVAGWAKDLWFSGIYWGTFEACPTNPDNSSLFCYLGAIGDAWNHRIWFVTWSTSVGIINNMYGCDNQTFYLLLWEVLHDQSKPLSTDYTQGLLLYDALYQINGAPCEGPYNYGNGNFSGGGWATEKRWEQTEDSHTNGDGYRGNFNGLDFMLLYNLYRLKNDEGIGDANNASYSDYLDRSLSGVVSSPVEYDAINSITSTQTINTNGNPVIYRAGNYIDLKPGFNSGSNFHAYIDHVNGCNTPAVTQDPLKKANLEEKPEIDTLSCKFDKKGNINDTFIVEAPFKDTTITIHGGAKHGGDSTIICGPFLYQWNFGNGQTANTRIAKVIYSKPGLYNFQLITTNVGLNKTDKISATIYKPDCTKQKPIYTKRDKDSTQTIQQMYISIIPNPNNGNMTVVYTIPENETGTLEIYDVFGRILLSYQLYGWQNKFNISATSLFDRGVYYYRATMENKQIGNGKIVVIK